MFRYDQIDPRQYADATPVVIDSSDQLGTMSSSRRFKKEIKSMDKASEAILALKPVTFHYNSGSDRANRFSTQLTADAAGTCLNRLHR